MTKANELFVRLDIGNVGMETSKHLADALRKIASRLEANEYVEDQEVESLTRGVMDHNGNTVGEWGLR
jgi:hypothetical protein